MIGQNDIFIKGVRKKWNMRNITKHIEWFNKDLEKPHKRGKNQKCTLDGGCSTVSEVRTADTPLWKSSSF